MEAPPYRRPAPPGFAIADESVDNAPRTRPGQDTHERTHRRRRAGWRAHRPAPDPRRQRRHHRRPEPGALRRARRPARRAHRHRQRRPGAGAARGRDRRGRDGDCRHRSRRGQPARLPDRAGRVEGPNQGAEAADPRGAALARRAGEVRRARRPDHPSRNRARREHHAGDPAARRVGRARVRGRRGAPGGDDAGRRQSRHRPDARAAVGRGAAGGFADRDDLPRPAGHHPARVGGARRGRPRLRADQPGERAGEPPLHGAADAEAAQAGLHPRRRPAQHPCRPVARAAGRPREAVRAGPASRRAGGRDPARHDGRQRGRDRPGDARGGRAPAVCRRSSR